ncbi:tRNA lysidine(34) synthetase TilS [Methylobacterium nodulans]|uniref:tRNA(Ile)-lysidine synthase n=1 Tax=Methylobacterium nodulans (strain LMG 21967 / CNCM I-2342 / ORS 2060) TaxID=460265 RepID=TILS_METNO|nr:tRNA lysidine(34) synthetase TilS [Methylobacterium nodulans]B8IP16.1 RecName: Full=tRNA(Ile)-lysidine synthase; AltName: Full=tRNA(Ile)-2-lysyl-cytidine synthase; AltName: Full=tRNA(Ile)-lysidine synthetase [Methylobacterium nodulans ORS 2060]ACL60334.1 tRNA(Ile)-lysidine synthetase [Methylobacterium nodulans ORS 2060]
MTEAARPLDREEFARRLDRWLGPGAAGGVVLAVSGGPDSTALMGGAARLPPLVPVMVATVDHGLRPEAAAEAEAVARLAGRLGLPHRILAWTGPKPRTRLQEAARAARYRLLLDLAREQGAAALLTAHTLDDQAETVLMRLCAGSGPAGLGGIEPVRHLGGLALVRPFLDLPKARLVATCAAEGWPFVVDPGNADARFARGRLRRVMPHLAAEGLTAARLARLAERLRRNEAALAAAADAALDALARPGARPGGMMLDARGLAVLPEAVALRVLARAIATVVGGNARPARLERLEDVLFGRLLPAIAAGGRLRCTLGGALLHLSGGSLSLSPEPPRRAG